MKNKLILFCCVLLLCLAGCNKVNRSTDLGLSKELVDAESTNIQTDLEMYLTLYGGMSDMMLNLSEDTTISIEEKTEKINLVFLKFMDDMDAFLAIRVSDDLGSLATSSELYLTYIALAQTYCETYQEEKETLVQYLDITNPEFDNNRAVRALAMVESFYLGLIEE